MNICYFAYPAFEQLINEVERNHDIEVKLTMSIAANSIQCYDLDHQAIIGEIRIHKGLEEHSLTRIALRNFFQVFDEFREKDLDYVENKTHQKIYSY